ncbi:MAG: hypothetical protein ABS36_12350 [Acidobacteria bacterium SCN 69-37]|nr:MAG: hypothetical protein ABS36_12350 [Acidobacteria bacterium SCN 69-37]
MLETLRKMKGGVWRGVFPHQLAFVLDLPGRGVLLSPTTLVKRLPLHPGCRALEIGAGSGHYSIAVGTKCRRLMLLDLQPEMLRKARARKPVTSQINGVAANASMLPFRTGSFDLVYMVTVFGEVSQQGEMLAEIRRVLAPGGVLSISEHLPDIDFAAFSSVRRLVERHGFELHRREGRPWSYTANFSKTLSGLPTITPSAR